MLARIRMVAHDAHRRPRRSARACANGSALGRGDLDAENCLGTECPQFGRCHVVAARRAAQAADIVIVNHHLLLADLALKEEGFGEMLPGAEAVVVDEAHQMPDLAAQFFGATLSAAASSARCCARRARRSSRARASRARGAASARGARRAAREARAARSPALGERARLGSACRSRSPAALDETRDALAAARRRAGRRRSGGPRPAPVRARARRSSPATLRRDRSTPEADSGPALGRTGARGFTLSLARRSTSRRGSAPLMKAQGGAWMFTSATLAVGDDFAHFLGRVGAPSAPHAAHREPVRLRAPGAALPAATACRIPRAAITRARRRPLRCRWSRRRGGRSFLLFTSHRALREAARAARVARRIHASRYPLLVQGEAPRERC